MVEKESLINELANYQQRKLDFDLVVKYSEIQYLVYILRSQFQCKWSYKYHATFALEQSWLYCHPKHLNRNQKIERARDILHQVDDCYWIYEPNLQCSLLLTKMKQSFSIFVSKNTFSIFARKLWGQSVHISYATSSFS